MRPRPMAGIDREAAGRRRRAAAATDRLGLRPIDYAAGRQPRAFLEPEHVPNDSTVKLLTQYIVAVDGQQPLIFAGNLNKSDAGHRRCRWNLAAPGGAAAAAPGAAAGGAAGPARRQGMRRRPRPRRRHGTGAAAPGAARCPTAQNQGH